MLKKSLSLFLILLMIGIFIMPVGAAEYTIRAGHTGAPDHHYQYGLEFFAEKVAEKTDGKVEILIFPADQLGGQRQETEGLIVGTHDMVLTSSMILSNFVPEIGAFDMPFLFATRDIAYAVADGEIGDDMAALHEAKGLKILAYWENGYRYITNSKRPIVEPEDLKGLKIRVPESPVFLATFATLGAAATPMAFGEVFSGLQLGIVDGQENPAAHVIHNAFFEVQKYLSLTGHFYTYEPLVISKALFDSFPADIQIALIEAAEEARDYQRVLSVEYDEDCLKQIKEKGMEILEVDKPAFQKAVQPVYEQFKDQYGGWVDRINLLAQ